MGCSSLGELSEFNCLSDLQAAIMGYNSFDLVKKFKIKTREIHNAFGISDNPAIKKCSLIDQRLNDEKNRNLFLKIYEENDRLVPLLQKKLDELRTIQNDKIIMIGKADCGKPCYAYNQKLFDICPECHRKVIEKKENSTEEKQVFDNETGQYKWESYCLEEGICLYFNFNDKVDECDYNFYKIVEYFDKEDKEKTVHWSCLDNDGNNFEADFPIHYMMIDGQRFDFPYGLQLKEFFFLNDQSLFPVNDRNWAAEGHCFGLFASGLQEKIGQSIGYYGVNNLHVVLYFECTSCKLQYHVIHTCPLMYRDKTKDLK